MSTSFDRDLWETRGRLPHYIRGDQRAEIEGACFRVRSQLSFLAQLSGLNGPLYWPSELMTTEGMRNAIQGAFLHGDEETVGPRSKIVGDRKFSIRDGKAYPYGLPNSEKYEEPITLYVGYEYEFEGYHADNLPGSVYDAVDDVTRLTPTSPGEELGTAGVDFVTEELTLEESRPSDYKGFLGLHGSKGSDKPLHWMFDSHGYVGYDDRHLKSEDYVVNFDFNYLPPKKDSVQESSPPWFPDIITTGGSIYYNLSEEGVLTIPPQYIPPDLEIWAKYPSTLIDSLNSGLVIEGGELELQGVESEYLSPEGDFHVKILDARDISFHTVFVPTTENSGERLRVKSFQDVQVGLEEEGLRDLGEEVDWSQVLPPEVPTLNLDSGEIPFDENYPLIYVYDGETFNSPPSLSDYEIYDTE